MIECKMPRFLRKTLDIARFSPILVPSVATRSSVIRMASTWRDRELSPIFPVPDLPLGVSMKAAGLFEPRATQDWEAPLGAL